MSATPLRCLLSDAERAEWERLMAWFLAWTPPAESYGLGRHCVVAEPARNHEYLCARVREGPAGLVQRAMLVRLRAHWVIFGGNSDGKDGR